MKYQLLPEDVLMLDMKQEHFQEVSQFAHQDMVEDLTQMEKQYQDQQQAA